MKTSDHSVHPDVAKAITTLNKALSAAYPSGDYAHTISVEGQVVAAVGGKEEIVPEVWTDVEAETAKRAKPEVAEPKPADSPGAEPIE